LGSNAYLFVETSEVGGTHPALIEAMAFGNCVIVNDTPQNLEVIGDAGLSYRGSRGPVHLRDLLRRLLEDEATVREYRGRAQSRAAEHYSWDSAVTRYEGLFERLLGEGEAQERW
ncbi:MAG TPA: glycosyltransferase, partial [Anaerolineae bacterium]|nr:glycosyltransferase [Anaerolineae bacterium]